MKLSVDGIDRIAIAFGEWFEKWFAKPMVKYYDIYDTCKHAVRYGVPNLIKWFVPIWKQRDWEVNHMYRLFAKKLEFMEECFRIDEAYHSENMKIA